MSIVRVRLPWTCQRPAMNRSFVCVPFPAVPCCCHSLWPYGVLISYAVWVSLSFFSFYSDTGQRSPKWTIQLDQSLLNQEGGVHSYHGPTFSSISSVSSLTLWQLNWTRIRNFDFPMDHRILGISLSLSFPAWLIWWWAMVCLFPTARICMHASIYK